MNDLKVKDHSHYFYDPECAVCVGRAEHHKRVAGAEMRKQPVNWTTKYPTQPGYYWFKNYILSAYPKMQPVSKPEVVSVTPEPDGFLIFRRVGDDRTWCVGDFIRAEWYGPIQPPQENDK